MSSCIAKIEHEGIILYGRYNGTTGYLDSQFYESEEECQKYWDKDDPRTTKKITEEIISRSVCIEVEISYGNNRYWSILFDPLNRIVIYNYDDSFQYQEMDRRCVMGYIDQEYESLEYEDKLKYQARQINRI